MWYNYTMLDLIYKNCLNKRGTVHAHVGRDSWWNSRNLNSLREWIFDKTSFLDKHTVMSIRIFHIIGGIEKIPNCAANECQRETKWNRDSRHYNTYCTAGCASRSTRGKAADTCMKNHGVSNPLNIKENRDKMRSSIANNKAAIQKKKISTCMKNHGVEYPQQSSCIREKSKQTLIKKYGVDSPTKSELIRNRVIETNLERYGHSCSLLNDLVKNKTLTTNVEKYGYYHHMKVDDQKKKVRDTTLANHGVPTILCKEWVREVVRGVNLEKYGVEYPLQNINILDKARETVRIRHNVDNPSKIGISDETIGLLQSREYMEDSMKEMSPTELSNKLSVSVTTVYNRLSMLGIDIPSRVSSMERFIIEFLEENISSTIECKNRRLISPLELDIYLPDYKIAIECNGSYYHSEKDKSNANGKDRHYHLNKTKLCEAQGIQLIHIWEHDWIKNPELIKRRLLSKLGKNEKVFARKTQVAKLTTQTSAEFLNQHHLQGTCPASVKYGLYEGEELLAVMTLGKARFSKIYEWELLRYCSTKQVIGGSSKLFSHFKKEYQPKSVVSYSDKMWNTGNLYKQLGFEHSHASKPSYYYTKDYLDFENRVAYQKHKLPKKLECFDPNLTEWENMQANGFDRIWDCGSDVWVVNRV